MSSAPVGADAGANACAVYFGVVLPPPSGAGANGDGAPIGARGVVVTSRAEVLNMLKAYKGGRFKAFNSEEDAREFSRGEEGKAGAAVAKEDGDNKGPSSAPSEGCPYPGLTPQQLKQMREAVLKEDEEAFDRLLEDNPRYIVSTCDTPAVVHSGTRSNPLHEAAKSGSVRMSARVLEAVQDPDLLLRMCPGESEESRGRRREHLMDLYLNMPNKGTNDTPLHLASKFGHLDVVRYLSGFSSCDASRLNRAGNTPAQEACSRSGDGDLEVKRAIQEVLRGQFYIPVIRDSDFNVPAYVGDPWSPNVTLSPSSSSSPHDEEAEDSPRIELAPSASSSSSAFSLTPSSPLASANNNPATNLNLLSTPRPKNNSQRGFRHRLVEGSPLLVVGGGGRGSNPASGNASFSSTAGVAGSVPGSPALDRSVGASPGGGGSSSGPTPIGSPLVVQALLGPLSPAEARSARDEWRTSAPRSLRLSDPLKGLERAGRRMLLSGSGRRWPGASLLEYWPFLDAYCDLASEDGMRLLDNHLHEVGQRIKRNRTNLDEGDCKDESLIAPTPSSPSDLQSPVSRLAADLGNFHITTPPQDNSTPDNSAPDKRDGNGNDVSTNNNHDPEEEEDFFDSASASPASSYCTAFEESDEVGDQEEEEFSEPVFIGGEFPSLVDCQVYEVLRDCGDLDGAAFPAARRWLRRVAAAAEEERSGWGRRGKGGGGRRGDVISVPKLVIQEEEGDEQ